MISSGCLVREDSMSGCPDPIGSGYCSEGPLLPVGSDTKNILPPVEREQRCQHCRMPVDRPHADWCIFKNKKMQC